eukprot:612435-Pyramimonas_sp.AAC.2
MDAPIIKGGATSFWRKPFNGESPGNAGQKLFQRFVDDLKERKNLRCARALCQNDRSTEMINPLTYRSVGYKITRHGKF